MPAIGMETRRDLEEMEGLFFVGRKFKRFAGVIGITEADENI